MTTLAIEVAETASPSSAHFLVVDRRFGVPIFVFLQRQPTAVEGQPDMRGRWVTLEQEPPQPVSRGGKSRPEGNMAIGNDPTCHDRFAEFATEKAVSVAGFTLIEPRYVGPTWEMYLSVFHPEGGHRKSGASQTRTPRFR